MKPVHLLRLLVFVLIGAALLIAVVPLLVLLSLVQGGSGFGLCPDGLGSCRNPYTAAPELTATLTVALLVVVALIRILMRSARRLQAEEREISAAAAAAPDRDRLDAVDHRSTRVRDQPSP